MDEHRRLWPTWVRVLKEQGLDGLVAGLGHLGEPVCILLCQLAYFATPLIFNEKEITKYSAFLSLLENKDEREEFLKVLQTSEFDS